MGGKPAPLRGSALSPLTNRLRPAAGWPTGTNGHFADNELVASCAILPSTMFVAGSQEDFAQSSEEAGHQIPGSYSAEHVRSPIGRRWPSSPLQNVFQSERTSGITVEIKCLQKPLLLWMPLRRAKAYADGNNAPVRRLSAVVGIPNDYDRAGINSTSLVLF